MTRHSEKRKKEHIEAQKAHKRATMGVEGVVGKGDTYRLVDRKKWDENYERIFGKKK